MLKPYEIMVRVVKSAPRDNMTREQLDKARKERSAKFKIEVSSASNLTYPSGYPRELKDYGDPVNLKFPTDSPARAANARVRFKQNADHIYDKEVSQKIVHNRIIEAELDHGITPEIKPGDRLDELLEKDLVERIEALSTPTDAAPAPEKPEDTDVVPKRKSPPPTVTKRMTEAEAQKIEPEDEDKEEEEDTDAYIDKMISAGVLRDNVVAHLTTSFLDEYPKSIGKDVGVPFKLEMTKGANGAEEILVAQLSDAMAKALAKKAEAHNDLYGDQASRTASVDTLRKVAMRAIQKDEAQKTSEIIARVNKYLTLLATGQRPEPFYVSDNDLLPTGHEHATT